MTATRGLHELRQHYLDSVAKIRSDVIDHVKQTKSNTAKKIRYITGLFLFCFVLWMGYGTIHFLFCFRNEVLRERHSTAKKLRRYYLQCLKQMLEEDRLALETSAALASAEEKMDKMKRALEAGSPGTDRTGERQEDVIGQIRKGL